MIEIIEEEKNNTYQSDEMPVREVFIYNNEKWLKWQNCSANT